MKPLSLFLAASCLAAVSLFAAEADQKPPVGTLPVAANSHALNFDFEDGTLRDWTATGEAFTGQPVKGPIDQNRKFGGGRVANHQGEFWIGGYEKLEDKPRGTLSSAKFKVTQPWAAFRLGGGSLPGTRLELVKAGGDVFFTARGRDNETMLPVVVDLQPVKDQEIFIRIVDEESGGWGHVNFDDFRFYASKPEFAVPVGAAKVVDNNPLPRDTIKFAGLSPEDAAKDMTLPEGFRATLFAGEPDVKQPIAFAIDDRGRLWVAEAYTYPKRAPEGEGKDRILVFEDTNGDGKFDKRTVFMEGLNLVSGLEVGFGGVWVGAAPYLMFIPMKDGDEPKPSGPPKILLDGWGYGDTHETMNTFTWGPDGWLYGCHGVFTQSNVGKPNATDAERTRINAGIWRYHPTKHKFEVFAEGTSNPWGLDFNENGQAIIEACVIPHLWHIIQNAHYQRQAGQHFNPNLYDDIKTIADHLHYASKTPHAGNGRSDASGGGHAHAGLMVYLGGSWPEKYKGQAFMNNIHGARINMDILEPQGSGYVGHHGADFILFNDVWSQIVNLQYDQDGSVYMIDWYDKNQCHNTNPDVHDRSNGRIFKVIYGDTKTTPLDLQKLSSAELVQMQLSPNEWRVRHARRILQERGPDPKVHEALKKILFENPDPSRRLRALWALHVTGGLDERTATVLLMENARPAGWRLTGNNTYPLNFVPDGPVLPVSASDPHLAAWAIQARCESGDPGDSFFKLMVRSAKEDSLPVVRLALASAVQRLSLEQRWDIVTALHTYTEDAGDHNLPLMAWYGLEPLAAADFNRGLSIALDSKLPRVLEFTARRVATLATPEAINAVVATLPKLNDEARQLAVLNGLSAALKGQRTVPLPAGWAAVEATLIASSNATLRGQAQSLALTFGSPTALAAARQTLADAKASIESRQRAVEALLNVKDAALPPLLLQLLSEPALRSQAIRGLAAFADPKTPDAILAIYGSLNSTEKRDALLTLVSRPAFAKPLVAAMANNQVATKDVSADIARQLRDLKQAELTADFEKVWGVMRETPADKLVAQAKYKTLIEDTKLPKPDLSHGRLLFTQTCGACHTLFGEGGKIGPDITGSNRADLDYLLHNILNPNAEIPNAYRMATVELQDGRVLAGIANQQDAKVVTVTTPNEVLTLPRNEIKTITQAEISMMPEGLLAPWSDREVRDLIAYLRSPAQVPLPVASAKTP